MGKDNENPKNNISWNSKIEKNVKQIGEKSKGYKIMHIQSSRIISTRYRWLMYSGILLGPLAGMLTGVGAILYPQEGPVLFPIAVTCISFISGIVVAISKFGKFEEKSSHHKIAASKYTSLESNVRRQLILCRTNRINAGTYLDYVGSSFDELFMTSPLVVRCTYTKYSKVAQKYGLVVPDEYGLTIDIDKVYQKSKINEMKDVSIISIHKNTPDNKQNDDYEIRLSIVDRESVSNEINIENDSLKGKTTIKRAGTFNHFSELNKYSDGQMVYEMKKITKNNILFLIIK